MDSLASILSMLDRMLQEGATDVDRQQVIEGLRETLHGELPSTVLGTLETQQVWECQSEISQLRQQLAEIGQKNSELETSVVALTEQLKPQPVDGNYTLEQFMAALAKRMGRTYGWRVDYVTASKETPGALEAETATIQQWQAKRLVPAAYYDQIDQLVFRKRAGKQGVEWSEENYDYLVELYNRNPKERNGVFADMCSQKFGREITENSVRGALDRLRKRDHRLPMRRPGREKRMA